MGLIGPFSLGLIAFPFAFVAIPVSRDHSSASLAYIIFDVSLIEEPFFVEYDQFGCFMWLGQVADADHIVTLKHQRTV